MQSQICLVARTVQPTPPTPTQGGGFVGRGTPRPARRLSFHILSSPEKKEYGPRRAIALLHGKNSKRRSFQPRKKSPKSQPQCVSNSEAASGLLTRPDDGCSQKSAWYPVQCAAAAPTPYQGWVLRAGAPALSGDLSFHILSSPEKKEYGPRRAIARLPGRY